MDKLTHVPRGALMLAAAAGSFAQSGAASAKPAVERAL
jgi:hypothetical protein